MPLVAGGYIRIGGSYSDFVHYYVPGTNYTRCPYTPSNQKCPGNSLPCCLPLTMERWREALEWAHSNGLRITFNLNILHGRYADYPGFDGHTHNQSNNPAWDSSNARALMQWTAMNVEPELWPAAFGLGNELNGYLLPEQWADDSITMYNLVQEIFGANAVAAPQTNGAGTRTNASRVPSTYGPGCDGLHAEWSAQYLNNITAKKPEALGAFSVHAYQHNASTVADVAGMSGSEVDASRVFFASVVAMHAAADSRSKLWITESAWGPFAPDNAGHGGATAALDGMCRASDMAWYLGALGSAAEAGIEMFCRESLAGDWLEVLGLWQPGDARTGEHNAPYTPHPDFWVAALWNKLMGTSVLGATTTTATSTSTYTAAATTTPAGSTAVVRAFAHCSKKTAGGVLFAVALSPCVRTEAVTVHFTGAHALTVYWLSANDAAADTVALNGQSTAPCCLFLDTAAHAVSRSRSSLRVTPCTV